MNPPSDKQILAYLSGEAAKPDFDPEDPEIARRIEEWRHLIGDLETAGQLEAEKSDLELSEFSRERIREASSPSASAPRRNWRGHVITFLSGAAAAGLALGLFFTSADIFAPRMVTMTMSSEPRENNSAAAPEVEVYAEHLMPLPEVLWPPAELLPAPEILPPDSSTLETEAIQSQASRYSGASNDTEKITLDDYPAVESVNSEAASQFAISEEALAERESVEEPQRKAIMAEQVRRMREALNSPTPGNFDQAMRSILMHESDEPSLSIRSDYADLTVEDFKTVRSVYQQVSGSIKDSKSRIQYAEEISAELPATDESKELIRLLLELQIKTAALQDRLDIKHPDAQQLVSAARSLANEHERWLKLLEQLEDRLGSLKSDSENLE